MVKFIGYDAGEGYRSDKVLLGDLADRKYSKWYPLMEWDGHGTIASGKSRRQGCPSRENRPVFSAPA